MNNWLIATVAAIVGIVLYLWIAAPKGYTCVLPTPEIGVPMMPPPALEKGSHKADYIGTQCSPEEQQTMKDCQRCYNDCIQASLEGKANFPDCHHQFMEECYPIVQKCMGGEEGS